MTAKVTVEALDEELVVHTHGSSSTKSEDGKHSSYLSTSTTRRLEPGETAEFTVYDKQSLTVRVANKYDKQSLDDVLAANSL